MIKSPPSGTRRLFDNRRDAEDAQSFTEIIRLEKRLKTKGKTLCLLTAVVLAALATGCANDKSIIREQSDGQLALTLSVSKAKCKEGELITAVVTLKNLTSDPLLVHWINIEPAYLSTADPEALPVGISENWRSAYESMMMLGRYECPGRSLLAFIPPENPRDAIEIYNRLLEGVRCGKGASVGLIPTRTVLTVTKEFKATRDMNVIFEAPKNMDREPVYQY
jgi:hypothetical protein